MAHYNDGIGFDQAFGPALAKRLRDLFARAGITTRAQLKTFVVNGALPGGATISAAQFGRALAVLGCGIRFSSDSDDDATDVG